MCEYYYDEDHGIAYKIDPVMANIVHNQGEGSLNSILVHTDVKLTNIKKEKVRRTVSEVYLHNEYDLDSAKKAFSDTLLAKLIGGAQKISEDEYRSIKERFEK